MIRKLKKKRVPYIYCVSFVLLWNISFAQNRCFYLSNETPEYNMKLVINCREGIFFYEKSKGLDIVYSTGYIHENNSLKSLTQKGERKIVDSSLKYKDSVSSSLVVDVSFESLNTTWLIDYIKIDTGEETIVIADDILSMERNHPWCDTIYAINGLTRFVLNREVLNHYPKFSIEGIENVDYDKISYLRFDLIYLNDSQFEFHEPSSSTFCLQKKSLRLNVGDTLYEMKRMKCKDIQSVVLKKEKAVPRLRSEQAISPPVGPEGR